MVQFGNKLHQFEPIRLQGPPVISISMSMSNLCHETCRIVFIKMTAKSNFLLARPKMAQMVKMPFTVFNLARLIFTSQTSHLDMIYP